MPSFRVGKPRIRLELTANKAMVGAGPWPVAWDVAVYEDPVVWSVLAPSVYVIPKTGLWLVNLCLVVTTSGSESRTALIQVNTVTRSRQGPSRTTAGTQGNSVSMQDELVVGDSVRALLELGGAVTPTVQAVGSFMAITRIGPERWTG